MEVGVEVQNDGLSRVLGPFALREASGYIPNVLDNLGDLGMRVDGLRRSESRRLG